MNIDVYINEISNILKYGNPWRSINHPILHYTTFYKFYCRLCSNNIFRKIYRAYIFFSYFWLINSPSYKFPLPHNIHDSKLIEDTINLSSIKIISSRIIADKGYINHKMKKKLKRKKISLIYPYRKNQKEQNTTFEKNLLKGRYIVENYFSWLKQYRRIQQRYDSTSINYFNFVYLASINIIINKLQ